MNCLSTSAREYSCVIIRKGQLVAVEGSFVNDLETASIYLKSGCDQDRSVISSYCFHSSPFFSWKKMKFSIVVVLFQLLLIIGFAAFVNYGQHSLPPPQGETRTFLDLT